MNNSFIEVFKNLIEDIDDPISLLANTSSYIYDQIKDLNWVGFYIYKNIAQRFRVAPGTKRTEL